MQVAIYRIIQNICMVMKIVYSSDDKEDAEAWCEKRTSLASECNKELKTEIKNEDNKWQVYSNGKVIILTDIKYFE